MTEHPALTPLALAVATLLSIMSSVIRDTHRQPPPPPPHGAPMQRRIEEIERKADELARIMREERGREIELSSPPTEAEGEDNKATSKGH